MKQIFVNLKRFEIPKSLGGICQKDDPKEWIEWIIGECVSLGIGRYEAVEVCFLLQENLLITAREKLADYAVNDTKSIKIGCQGVFRENAAKGGNFGAFTTNLPAAAVSNMGCKWTIIGHSEERRDKLGIIAHYDPTVLREEQARNTANAAVDKLINEELLCALDAQMKALVCIGETAEEKGEGSFEEQKPGIEAVLKAQLLRSLAGVEAKQCQDAVVIGYEPIWAIGPGKTPPGAEYISFVSAYIKQVVKENFGFEPAVVYGGGLKEENAGTISKIGSIDGGLVALTKFTGEIGFYPEDLKIIIDKYIE